MKRIVFIFTLLVIVLWFVGADIKDILAPFDYGKVTNGQSGSSMSGIGCNVIVMGIAVDTSDCAVGTTRGFYYDYYKTIGQTNFARYRIYADADTYIMSVVGKKGVGLGKMKVVVDGDSIATIDQDDIFAVNNITWNVNVTFTSSGEHTIDFVELNIANCYIGMFWLRRGIYP
ncbi:MAG: hypothetical protein WBB37_07660 [bacterium]